jgi:hypothetical protein
VFLLFLALLYSLYGYSLLITPPRGLGSYTYLLPIMVWVVVWFTGAAACLVSAPMRHDRAGFIVAAVVMAGWASMWAQLWIVQGFPHGWVSLVVWGTFSGVEVMVSGWSEPPPRDLP